METFFFRGVSLPVSFALMVSEGKQSEKRIVQIFCYMHYSDCKDGEVRLVGGNSDSAGTVEICLKNLWGLVVESGWSLADAQVVCSQLGFPLDGNNALWNFWGRLLRFIFHRECWITF